MKELSRFERYELVRDGTDLRGAQLTLLHTIAWRANPKEKYSCFPSMELLVDETHYTEQNLRIAIKALEKVGLIKRRKRSYRSSVFYLNVARLIEMARVRKAEKAAVVEPVPVVDDYEPFESDPFPDDLDSSNPDAQYPPLCHDIGELVCLLEIFWPKHASVTNNRDLLTSDLEECVEIAGNPQRCCDAIYYANQDAKTHDLVANSRKLGRYLLSALPTWLERFADQLPATEESEVSDEYTD